jgi:hypothetical protein
LPHGAKGLLITAHLAAVRGARAIEFKEADDGTDRGDLCAATRAVGAAWLAVMEPARRGCTQICAVFTPGPVTRR